MDNEMILHIYEDFAKQRDQKLRGMFCLRTGRRAQKRLPQTAPRCSTAQEHDA
jgi:hypothetical protein